MSENNFEQPKDSRPEKESTARFEGDRWELPTNLAVVDEAQDRFNDLLREKGWDEDAALNMALGFREALINAIVHGNLGISAEELKAGTWGEVAIKKITENPTDKKVLVTLEVKPDDVTLTVIDEGAGFDWKNKKDPRSTENITETRGRGTFFMETFFDSVQYNEKGNEVTLRTVHEGILGKYDEHWPDRLPKRLKPTDVVPYIGNDGQWHWHLRPEKVKDPELREQYERQLRQWP